MRNIVATILMLGLLASCDSTSSSQQAINSSAIATTTVDEGVKSFVQLCYTSYPTFEEVPNKAKSKGFSYSSGTKSYVRSSDGMSVKVFRNAGAYVCSFSFATEEPHEVFAAAMRAPFNATRTTLPGYGEVFASRVQEGGTMIASTGTRIGSATQYELILTVVPK